MSQLYEEIVLKATGRAEQSYQEIISLDNQMENFLSFLDPSFSTGRICLNVNILS